MREAGKGDVVREASVQRGHVAFASYARSGTRLPRKGGLAHLKYGVQVLAAPQCPLMGRSPAHNWDVCVRLQVACGRGWQGVEGTEGCCARGKSLVYKRHLVRAQKRVIKEI